MQLTTELLSKPSRYSVEKKPVFSQQNAPVKPRNNNFQATGLQFSGCGSWDSDGFQKAPVLTNPKTVFAANLSNTNRIQSNFISAVLHKPVTFGANRHEPTDLPVEKIIQEVRESVIDTQYIESENNDKVSEILDKASAAMKDGKKEAFIKTELDALLEDQSIIIAHTENSAQEPIPVEAPNPVTKAVYKLLAELETQTPALPLETKLEKALEQVSKTWTEVSPTLNDYDKQEVEKSVTVLNTKLQEFSYRLQQNTQAEVVYETQLIKPLQALHESIVKAESGENEEWRDPDAEKSEFEKSQEEQPDFGEGDTMLLGPQNVAEQALEEAKKLRDRHYLGNLMKLHYKLMADPTSAEKHQRLSDFIYHKFDSLKPSAEMATSLSEVAANSPVLQIREFTTRYLHYYFAKSKASDVTEALLEKQPQLLEKLKSNPESQELISKKPITFKLAQEELKELPLFLYQFGHPTYDEGMHQYTINVGLKPLLDSESIETRIQAGLALLENDYKLTRKEASLIQNDLIKLWDEYIEGDKQVGETKIGKNLFELTQALTIQKSTPIFNKLSQVIFDYATPDADKGQIFGLMSQWLKHEPFNLEVAPLTISPWKEGDVLEEPTSSAAKKAPKPEQPEIPVFDYATAFKKVENKLLDTKSPKLFATVLGHILDLAEYTARPKKQDGTTSTSTAPASSVGSNDTPEFVDPKKLRGELAHLKAHLPKIQSTLTALEQGTLPSDDSGDDISQALDNAVLTTKLQKLIQLLK